MKLYDKDTKKKASFSIFKISNIENLIISVEKLYHEFWYTFDDKVQTRLNKDILRIIDKLYEQYNLTEGNDMNYTNSVLTLRDFDLILTLIETVLVRKRDKDLENTKLGLELFFKRFNDQFDVIL